MATKMTCMVQTCSTDNEKEAVAALLLLHVLLLLLHKPQPASGIKAAGEINYISERQGALLCSRANSRLSSFLSHADTDVCVPALTYCTKNIRPLRPPCALCACDISCSSQHIDQ